MSSHGSRKRDASRPPICQQLPATHGRAQAVNPREDAHSRGRCHAYYVLRQFDDWRIGHINLPDAHRHH